MDCKFASSGIALQKDQDDPMDSVSVHYIFSIYEILKLSSGQELHVRDDKISPYRSPLCAILVTLSIFLNCPLGKVPTNELQIYTWPDASLKELTSLVREVNPESRRKGTFFDFALIYPSQTPRGSYQRAVNQFMDYQSRDIGTTVSGRKGVDDSKVK